VVARWATVATAALMGLGVWLTSSPASADGLGVSLNYHERGSRGGIQIGAHWSAHGTQGRLGTYPIVPPPRGGAGPRVIIGNPLAPGHYVQPGARVYRPPVVHGYLDGRGPHSGQLGYVQPIGPGVGYYGQPQPVGPRYGSGQVYGGTKHYVPKVGYGRHVCDHRCDCTRKHGITGHQPRGNAYGWYKSDAPPRGHGNRGKHGYDSRGYDSRDNRRNDDRYRTPPPPTSGGRRVLRGGNWEPYRP